MPGPLGGAPAHRSPRAERQRERERVGLLAVEPVQLKMGARRLVEDLGARTAQLVGVAAAHGDEAAEADLAVSGGELGLAPGGRLPRLALARGLGLAEARAQLAVGPIPRDRRLDLAGGASAGERLEGDGHRADRPELPSSGDRNSGETSSRGQLPIQ